MRFNAFLNKNWIYILVAQIGFIPVFMNAQENEPIEITIVGTLHFNQFHNPNKPETNFLGQSRQAEFADVIEKLSVFNPDAVFVEREPKIQNRLDSLFQGVSNFENLKNGPGELYQIGFKLSKKNNLSTVYGVDYYESVSQNLFEKGKNLSVFKDSLKVFQNKGRGITMKFLKGESSVREFLVELNRPENIELSHRLFFNTPAYVVEGEFKNAENFKNVDTNYIGAEYIALFYKRNLKIYSNILAKQKEINAKRILLIVGQVHVGVLQSMLQNNPRFKVVPVNAYLDK